MGRNAVLETGDVFVYTGSDGREHRVVIVDQSDPLEVVYTHDGVEHRHFGFNLIVMLKTLEAERVLQN